MAKVSAQAFSVSPCQPTHAGVPCSDLGARRAWLARGRLRSLLRIGPRSSSGYTLVELLVGVVLGVAVLGSLGGVLLLSDLRVSSTIRRTLDDNDSLNRTINLIRSEAAASTRIDQGGFPTYVPNPSLSQVNSCSFALLRIHHISGSMICYSVMSATTAASIQGLAASPWTASSLLGRVPANCVLVRSGPAYSTVGINPQSARINQVVLDNLSVCNFTSMQVTFPPASGSYIRRGAGIAISYDKQSPRVVRFMMTSHSSAAYDGNILFNTNCNSSTAECPTASIPGSGQKVYKPLMNSGSEVVPGPSGLAAARTTENVAFFLYPFSSYVVEGESGGACTYAKCVVRSKVDGNQVTLQYMNILRFADREVALNQ